MAPPLLALEGVTKRFGGGWRSPPHTAVADVDLEVERGTTVGLVGASGAGKSTIGRLIVRLLDPDAGQVLLDGRDVADLDRRDLGRRVHLVFQDPYASLAPHLRVGALVGEPLAIHGVDDRAARVGEALQEVHLTPVDRFLARYPHELSGGERQRVALARALVLRPDLVVADEPTQMLDASIRAELLDVMRELRRAHGMTFLYITHDLALARGFCDRLAVIDRGRLVEHGPTEQVLRRPASRAARELVGAVSALHAGLPDGA